MYNKTIKYFPKPKYFARHNIFELCLKIISIYLNISRSHINDVCTSLSTDKRVCYMENNFIVF